MRVKTYVCVDFWSQALGSWFFGHVFIVNMVPLGWNIKYLLGFGGSSLIRGYCVFPKLYGNNTRYRQVNLISTDTY